MRRSSKLAMVVLLLVLLYIVTFYFWWVSSPVGTVKTKTGARLVVVEFHYNTISYHTAYLWFPAFWFMEYFCGYQAGDFVAMYEHSIQKFTRPAP